MKSPYKILLIFYLLLGNYCHAQNKLTAKEIEGIKKQSLNIVFTFDRYISHIATSTAAGATNVDLLIYRAMDLFIDSTAIVEVSNINRRTIDRYSIRRYLLHVIANYKTHYAVVEFEAIPYKKVDLKEIKENGVVTGYKATVHYRQTFKAKKGLPLIVEGTPEKTDYDYSDETEKEATVIIKKVVDENKQTIWIIKLGDIKVTSTTN